ncbi:uncharacterized protein TRIVIDRAFT_215253 [Trichoderma virens Gv29-8]|uniref:Uncharacterized protein n=1 Tax=Hypocrea virens (strain Gv29-8 / FGSC 10586) TaxID=413071 RepID=G9MI05_HYPVG|nr:uncharacterized protein TRIVIDRAFT_215253 [Trichoderma virens Gv29-8]EHK26340.1 hypothetical protein TRIVIDRAFT_215253 [Trichoderma virens Gv29-8]
MTVVVIEGRIFEIADAIASDKRKSACCSDVGELARIRAVTVLRAVESTFLLSSRLDQQIYSVSSRRFTSSRFSLAQINTSGA